LSCTPRASARCSMAITFRKMWFTERSLKPQFEPAHPVVFFGVVKTANRVRQGGEF
jgi:hypothetical protein